MDWIKQNRFLAGYLGIMIVGVLALGVFNFLNWRSAKAAEAGYESTERNLSALERRPIFPSAQNLSAKERQVESLARAVEALHAKAVKLQRPLKRALTERQFRAQMNAESDAFKQFAEEKGMIIPDEFKLGMEEYVRGKSINPRAVPLLEWQLEAIKRFATLAAEAGIAEIEAIEREVFPEEDINFKPEDEEPEPEAGRGSSGRRTSSGRSSSGRRGGRGASEQAEAPENPMATASQVMETYRYVARVNGSHSAVRELLNTIAHEDTYCMWVRILRLENEVKDSPSEADIPNPAPVAGVDAGPDEEPPMNDAFILFGNEKVYARLVIDLVRFKQPEGEAPAEADPDPAPDPDPSPSPDPEPAPEPEPEPEPAPAPDPAPAAETP